MADTGPHLCHVGDAVGLAEQLPCLRDPQSRRVAEEPSADHPVVRVVSLEKERLTRGQDVELPTATGLPEIYFLHPGAGSKEAVPIVVCHADVSAHRNSRLYSLGRCLRSWP